MKKIPFKFQNEIIEKVKDKQNIGLFLDMGLGKTLIATELIKGYFGNRTIVILCKKSLREQWREHLKRQYNQNSIIMINDDVDNMKGKVTIVNYELARNRKQLLNLKDVILVLDEAQTVKNRTSQIAKFIKKMDYERILLLSGTPTSGKYDDLYNLSYLLGYNINYRTFTNQYCISKRFKAVENRYFRKIIDFKNIDRLTQKIEKYGGVFLKTEGTIDLPEQTDIIYKVNNTCMYDEFRKERILRVDNELLVGETQMSMFLGLRYLSSALNINKINMVKDLLQCTNDRIIIFYNYNLELSILEKLCIELGRDYTILNSKNHVIESFKQDSTHVLLAQFQTGSEGYNLQMCNKIIYFSLPFSYNLFSQSKKRINRIGQTKACFYYYLLTKNSVDNDIFECLKEKRNYSELIFNKGKKDDEKCKIAMLNV